MQKWFAENEWQKMVKTYFGKRVSSVTPKEMVEVLDFYFSQIGKITMPVENRYDKGVTDETFITLYSEEPALKTALNLPDAQFKKLTKTLGASIGVVHEFSDSSKNELEIYPMGKGKNAVYVQNGINF
jgi:histone H3/H4